MIEDNIKKTVKAFTDIVEAIEALEIIERETVSRLKARLRLFDGSILWVREVWIKGVMEDYSSNNTWILNVEEIKEVLLNVDYIQKELLTTNGTNYHE